jgi:hypothetical protein
MADGMPFCYTEDHGGIVTCTGQGHHRVGHKEAFMARRAFANKLRLVLGVAMAVIAGFATYGPDGPTVWTYVLPSVILLLTLADFIGYLSSQDDDPKRSHPNSAAEPGITDGHGQGKE